MLESGKTRFQVFVMCAFLAALAAVAPHAGAYADGGPAAAAGGAGRAISASALQVQAKNPVYGLIAKDGCLYPCSSKGKKTSNYWNDNNWAASTAINNLKQVFIAADVTSVTDGALKYKTVSTSYGGTYYSSSTVYHLLGNSSSKIATVTFLLNGSGTNACKKIGAYTFSWNGKLSAVRNLDKTKVTSIGNNAFRMSGVKSIALPKTLSALGKDAFSDCSKLTTVSKLDKTKVKTVGDSAFDGCGKLASVKLPNTCTKVGDWAFSDCQALKSVSLGSKLKVTGKYAFDGCKKLASVSLPATCAKLGYASFYGCSALQKVVMRSKSVVRNAQSASADQYAQFFGTKIAKTGNKAYIYVPKSLLSKYRSSSYSNIWRDYRTKFRAI